MPGKDSSDGRTSTQPDGLFGIRPNGSIGFRIAHVCERARSYFLAYGAEFLAALQVAVGIAREHRVEDAYMSGHGIDPGSGAGAG